MTLTISVDSVDVRRAKVVHRGVPHEITSRHRSLERHDLWVQAAFQPHHLYVLHLMVAVAAAHRQLTQHVCNLLPLDAAVLLAASQVSNIIRFFLSKNIRIARDRAWNQTVASRGKGPEFWQPYVEEWSSPPKMKMKEGKLDKVGSKFGGWLGVMFVKRGSCPGSCRGRFTQCQVGSASSAAAVQLLSFRWGVRGCVSQSAGNGEEFT